MVLQDALVLSSIFIVKCDRIVSFSLLLFCHYRIADLLSLANVVCHRFDVHQRKWLWIKLFGLRNLLFCVIFVFGNSFWNQRVLFLRLLFLINYLIAPLCIHVFALCA